MLTLIILSVGTILVAGLGLLIAIKARSLVPLVPLTLIYYWTLFGAWSFILVKLSEGDWVLRSYLEYRLFRIDIDKYYASSLLLYVVFIVVIELCVLVLMPRGGLGRLSNTPVHPVSHWTLLLVGSGAALVSYLLVRPEIARASDAGVSVYVLTREGGLGSFSLYTIHQLTNLVAQISTMLGFAIFLSGKRGNIFSWRGFRPALLLAYILVLSAIFMFNFTLGNRAGLFGTVIAAVSLYLMNAKRPRILRLTALAGVGLWVITLIAFTRGGRVVDFESAAATLAESISNPLPIIAEQVGGSESIAAHMSLYGILKYDLPPTGGSSIVSLVASVIPRNIWPNRPDDIYRIYARELDAPLDQNFTIHHAAGWYLNFGGLGLMAGALLLGGLWGGSFYCFSHLVVSSRLGRLIVDISPAMLSFYIPIHMIRSGPEAYKALFLESLLLPGFVFLVASVCARPFKLGPRHA